MNDNRQVTITSTRPNLSVTAWYAADPATIISGYGGWEVIARPKRQSITAWKGHDPFQLDLPILLDGYVGGESVEARCSALERMGRPQSVGEEPPLIKVMGHVPHNDLTWVLQAIRWGDVSRSTNGQRVRQGLTLSLLRYIADDRVQLQGAASRVRASAAKAGTSGKTGGKSKPYTVQTGDTLRSIAQKRLGDDKKWTDIATLNGIRDPKSIKVGQVLRIP